MRNVNCHTHPQQQSQIIRGTSIVMLGALLAIYLRAGFIVEAVFLLHAAIAHTAFLIWEYRKSPARDGTLITFVIAINIFSAGLLFFRNIPQNHAYELLGDMRDVFIGMFLIIALLSGFSFIVKIKLNRFLHLLPTFPWLVWCYVFFRTSGIPNLIAPITFAGVLFFGDVIPWQRLVLPQGDIIGRRTILVGSLTSTRPYRTKSKIEDAFDYLREQSGTLFDPEVVEMFIHLIADGKFDDFQLTD